MLYSRWMKTLGLLVVAVAVCVSGEAEKGETEGTNVEGGTDNPWIRDDVPQAEAVPAESQQISAVADTDLLASATDYGKHYKGHKGYKGGYHDKEGHKGKKGYKADKGYKKKHYGDYGKDHKKGYHDNDGKYYKGHQDKYKYYGDEHKGEKGKKGHHYGTKGHHNKGHKDKGFKNVYHKEEYHHNKKYYDDHDSSKYHDKYDDYDSYFKANKGKDYKGGHYKGARHQLTDEPNLIEPLIISRARAALERMNDISSRSKNEVSTRDKPPTQEADQDSVSMRYVGRTLLDTGSKSRGRSKFHRRKFYDKQCQVHDLRKIRRYLMYCVRHSGDVGPPPEGAPPCSEEDLFKIKKYLNFCQMPFLAKASRRDKKVYKKLKVIAKKLDQRNNIIDQDEEEYEARHYAAEVCNVMDLRQMKIYLQDCHSQREPEEGRPSCEVFNYQKCLDYLSTCETFFLAEASRRDRRKYGRMIAVASGLIKEEETESPNPEEREHMQSECKVEDLRETQTYVLQCEKLMQVEDYKRIYGNKVCQSSHLSEIYRYLLKCENYFLADASEKDRKKYTVLTSISETLGSKRHKDIQKTERSEEITNECKIQDLRKIPKYLRACHRSQSCDMQQLSKVHNFLISCQSFFLQSASRKDERRYNDLLLKSEMMSTKENIEQWREEQHDKREQIESICKIHVLRKVPKYIKKCRKSRDCKIKKLLKVQEFLTFCEDFFTIAASPKDRGKYVSLMKISGDLAEQEKYEPRKDEGKQNRNREPNCDIRELRKIPKYLKDCVKSENCNIKQLSKVYHFLFVCHVPFTSTASPKDKAKYKKFMSLSERLSKNKPSSKYPARKHGERSKCKIKDLRKIPSYLSNCKKSQNCKKMKLHKIHTFLHECKTSLTQKATKKEKNEYNKIHHTVRKMMNQNQKKHSGVKQSKQAQRGHQQKRSKYNRQQKGQSKHSKQHQRESKRSEKQLKESKRMRQKHGRSKHTEQKQKESKHNKGQHRRSSQKQQKEEQNRNSCQTTDLRKIPDYLENCIKSKKCNKKQLSKVNKFLSTCKKPLTSRASKTDKRKYDKLIKVSEKLISEKNGKRESKREKGHTQHDCTVKILRKIDKYIHSCSVKGTCKRTQVRKSLNYISTCRRTLIKGASKREKQKYTHLMIQSKKLLGKESSSTPKSRKKGESETLSKSKDARRRRDSKSEGTNCEIQILRKANKYVKDCSAKTTGRGRKPQSAKCEYKNLIQIQNYLPQCQSTFLRGASHSDKKQYKSLSARTIKLAEDMKGKRTRRTEKRQEIFSCDKKSLQKLERHVKYCKARERRNSSYNKRKQEKVREIRNKRQFRRTHSGRKTSRSMEKSERRRCLHKDRQGGKHHDQHGKKGHHEKGKYHDDHKGHKGHYEHKGHYGDKSSYGKKGGHKGQYGHEDYKKHDDSKGHGYGHDDHHGKGYGHDDHHGQGYGHDDHHGHARHMYPYYGPRLPIYCYRWLRPW